jgi:hypothetical protein
MDIAVSLPVVKPTFPVTSTLTGQMGFHILNNLQQVGAKINA